MCLMTPLISFNLKFIPLTLILAHFTEGINKRKSKINVFLLTRLIQIYYCSVKQFFNNRSKCLRKHFLF